MCDQYRLWRPGEKDKLAADYANGVSVADLAKWHGRTEHNIRTVLYLIDAPLRQPRTTVDERGRVLRMIAEGRTDQEIAEAVGKSRATIWRIRNQRGRKEAVAA